MSDELVPRTPAATRARRSPWGIAGVWAWEALFAAIAGWPAVSLARAAYGSHPRGDEPLWAAGAHSLLDFLARDAHGVTAAISAATAVLLVAAVAGLLPMGALMTAVAYSGPDGRAVGFARAVRRAIDALPSLGILLVVVGVMQALAVGAAIATSDIVGAWTRAALGEAHAQQLGAAAGLAFVVAAVVLGVVHDLARAAVIRLRMRGMRALSVALGAYRQAPWALAWSWVWRALGSLVPIVFAAAAARALGGGGAALLLLLALVHQVAVLGRAALRASWLAKALRCVAAISAPAPPTVGDDEP